MQTYICEKLAQSDPTFAYVQCVQTPCQKPAVADGCKKNVQKLLYCGENGAVIGQLLDNCTAYALLLDNQSSYR